MSEFRSLEPSPQELAEYAAWEQRQKEKRAEEAGAPLLEGLGFWVPPCVDVFIGNSAYVWYRLLQFTGDCDLDIERYDGGALGEPQTWFEEYEDSLNFWYGLTGSRHDGTRGLSFAFEEGIAPGTPFLMQFGPPHWYRSSYEYNEYDVDYDYEIVRVLPRDPVKGLRSFERAFALKKRHDEARARYRQRLDALQRSDIKAMFFEQSLYYVDRYIDEMSMPTGCQVSLCSSHTKLPHEKHARWGRRDFCSGQDPESWEKAFENLYVEVEKKLGLKKNQIEHLPKKWRH